MTGKTLEIISQIIVWFENSFRKDSMPLCGSFAKKSKILYQVRQQHNTDCQLIGVQFDSIEFVELMQVLGFTALNSALIQLRYVHEVWISHFAQSRFWVKYHVGWTSSVCQPWYLWHWFCLCANIEETVWRNYVKSVNCV